MCKLKILLAATTFFTSLSFAGTSEQVSLTGKTLQIISTGTSRVYISKLPIKNGGCDNDIPVLIFSGPNANPMAKELYSALLTAKASGKKVVIQTKGCWSDFSTPLITSINLLD